MSDSYQAIYDAVRSRIQSVDVGSIFSEVLRGAFDMSYAMPQVVQSFTMTAVAIQEQATRPSVLYRPTLFNTDPDTWVAAYGDFEGLGRSPGEAMADFDKKWNLSQEKKT